MVTGGADAPCPASRSITLSPCLGLFVLRQRAIRTLGGFCYTWIMIPFEFRPVAAPDLAFCWPIYREAMEPLETALGSWNDAARRREIEATLAEDGASILTADDADAGWLHVTETRHVIHLTHLYLRPDLRNRGLGSSFLKWMIDRARHKGKEFTLEVLSNSPARGLYERFGFGVTSTGRRTLGMKLNEAAR